MQEKETVPASADDPYLETSGAARRRKCSENTIRNKANSGELPHIKTDTGERLFRASDVDALAVRTR